eukprot:TRINITY_DN12413_c0_g1_i1.p1 TRINITY_DN12413_c0_g1~~TRINITY_DN12413_c0_g1_i1.p1  ORF type:complete len:389 (-),score=81.17 TRINITY_DN12413_c0_g1_i1:468-1610(-)
MSEMKEQFEKQKDEAVEKKTSVIEQTAERPKNHLDKQMLAFIKALPKVELHLHIEGTFEPDLMFAIAKRNKINLKYESVDQVKKAYEFENLQQFLDLYYGACSVLLTEQDFFDLFYSYLEKAAKESNVRHVEAFFDPQTHTSRGVSFETVANGFIKAQTEALKKLKISSQLIMCFLRHLSEKEAESTLDELLGYLKKNPSAPIIGVGLDSGEVGNPPSKFKRVFSRAVKAGLLPVAHAGEEGNAEMVLSALDDLKVKRIDHGVRSLEDEKLLARLVKEQIPLTVCPLSNRRLQVFQRYFKGKNAFGDLFKKKLVVTCNSDDPSYFGGYMNENFIAIAEDCHLSKKDLALVSKNSIVASFLSKSEKDALLVELNAFIEKNV